MPEPICLDPAELAELRRKAAAIDAMERWGLDVRLNHGWCVYQRNRTELAETGFYADLDYHYDTPLAAIEAAVTWLEKQEKGT